MSVSSSCPWKSRLNDSNCTSLDCGWLVRTPVVDRSLTSKSSSCSFRPLKALFSASESWLLLAALLSETLLPPFFIAAFFFLESDGL